MYNLKAIDDTYEKRMYLDLRNFKRRCLKNFPIGMF
jgi:hypothetical protein